MKWTLQQVHILYSLGSTSMARRSDALSLTPRHGVVVGFAAVEPRGIRRGVRELASALRSISRRRGRR